MKGTCPYFVCCLLPSFMNTCNDFLSIYTQTHIIFPSSPFKEKGLRLSFSMSHHTEMVLAPPSISVLIGSVSYNTPDVY